MFFKRGKNCRAQGIRLSLTKNNFIIIDRKSHERWTLHYFIMPLHLQFANYPSAYRSSSKLVSRVHAKRSGIQSRRDSINLHFATLVSRFLLAIIHIYFDSLTRPSLEVFFCSPFFCFQHFRFQFGIWIWCSRGGVGAAVVWRCNGRSHGISVLSSQFF